MRASFKNQVGNVRQRGDLHRGMRRLRRLGILKDGGEAGTSTDEDGSEEDSGDDEEEEEDEEDGEEEEEDEEEELAAVAGDSDGDEAEVDEDGAAPEPSAPLSHSAGQKSRGQPSVATVSGKGAAAEAAVRGEQRRGGRNAADELPFTFEAPSTHAEFAQWVNGRSAADLSAVVERVVACNAISLAADNRQKLQVFFGVLLVHFDALAQQTPLPQAHLDALVPHLLVRRRLAALHCFALRTDHCALRLS